MKPVTSADGLVLMTHFIWKELKRTKSSKKWINNERWVKGYYLFFPARDHDDIFRIGVATSSNPAGPFKAEENYIPGSISIDPAVLVDDDNRAYVYFGGLWGGQLEKWQTGSFIPDAEGPAASEPALGPRVAELTEDMLPLRLNRKRFQLWMKVTAPFLLAMRKEDILRVHGFKLVWSYSEQLISGEIAGSKGLVMTAIGLFLFFDLRLVYTIGGTVQYVLTIPLLIIVGLYLITLLYLFPVYVHFDLRLLAGQFIGNKFNGFKQCSH